MTTAAKKGDRANLTILTIVTVIAIVTPVAGQNPWPPVAVEAQPLASQCQRLVDAFDRLGAPLSEERRTALKAASNPPDAARLQMLLDPHVTFLVTINPESRVRVERGPATTQLQQGGFVPLLVKVVNQASVTARLKIQSPQAGPRYAGVAELSMTRQQQPELRENENLRSDPRFLQVQMDQQPPLTKSLSGLEVEYAIALISSHEAGAREAVIGFDVGQGTQDLGFRGETPVLFQVRPAVKVHLKIRDVDGTPTTARLLFRDAQDRVYPPQPARLAPDLFFQAQIYRHDGETVDLPPGKLTLEASRGPEYRVLTREIEIPNQAEASLDISLERWVDPRKHGFYSGDHHIHAAGCAHYTSPTEGVSPADMFRQVQGEGLNVGCVLTWGPCFDYQQRFNSPRIDGVSTPLTIIKYDLEISGFGSQALGHVCLLNLREHLYPGTTSTKGWPTWTTPVMRWTKQQGGVTGYAHSASGLQVDVPESVARTFRKWDRDEDQELTPEEAAQALLPYSFIKLDADQNGVLSPSELNLSFQRATHELPNLLVPEMNGVGAMEVGVTTAQGLCDFISAMDTPRIAEWNCWYHILNCGFPLKVSGETDFPCMSGANVGQGRVYVQLGPIESIDYAAWCHALAQGRSYVSDGYAHALKFTVQKQHPGPEPVKLAAPGKVIVEAIVAFAADQPLSVMHGGLEPTGGRKLVGDTVTFHTPKTNERQRGGMRRVELIVNGRAAAAQDVIADGNEHLVKFEVGITQSSWVALRQFPQLHTNPVPVIIADQPIRASRLSARWCQEMIQRLWEVRGSRIAEHERAEAERTFQEVLKIYRQREQESPENS